MVNKNDIFKRKKMICIDEQDILVQLLFFRLSADIV